MSTQPTHMKNHQTSDYWGAVSFINMLYTGSIIVCKIGRVSRAWEWCFENSSPIVNKAFTLPGALSDVFDATRGY
jgi:hypothetical protein